MRVITLLAHHPKLKTQQKPCGLDTHTNTQHVIARHHRIYVVSFYDYFVIQLTIVYLFSKYVCVCVYYRITDIKYISMYVGTIALKSCS